MDGIAFQSLDEFPLAWRWTRLEQDSLKPDVLADIRPLTIASANRIAEEARSRCAEAPIGEFAETWSAEWDDPDSVRSRLNKLGIDPSRRVFVSWSADMALETSWHTFVEYWEAFCYPSSDDVTIWTWEEPWSVCYRHFRVMQVRLPDRAI